MEARRQAVKAYADNFKHYLTVSGATAVGTAVIHDALNLSVFGTVLTLVALAAAFILAALGMTHTTTFFDDEGTRVRWIGMSRQYLDQPPSERLKGLYTEHFWTLLLLTGARVVLALNVFDFFD
jgi:hypothetical protein